MRARKIRWIALAVVLLLAAGAAYLAGFHSHYAELSFPPIDQFPNGKTSYIIPSNQTSSLAITVYNPDDPHNGGVSITDAAGKSCTTDAYLITRLLLSKDEKKLLIYYYSGSNQYRTTIDTTSCQPISPTEVLDGGQWQIQIGNKK